LFEVVASVSVFVHAVHHIAARYKLTTASVGEGFDRHVVVTYVSDCEMCVAHHCVFHDARRRVFVDSVCACSPVSPDESLRDIYTTTAKVSLTGSRKEKLRGSPAASLSREASASDDKAQLASAISAALHSGGSRSDTKPAASVDSVTLGMEAVSLKPSCTCGLVDCVLL
jgi:hypothetical protein